MLVRLSWSCIQEAGDRRLIFFHNFFCFPPIECVPFNRGVLWLGSSYSGKISRNFLRNLSELFPKSLGTFSKSSRNIFQNSLGQMQEKGGLM